MEISDLLKIVLNFGTLNPKLRLDLHEDYLKITSRLTTIIISKYIQLEHLNTNGPKQTLICLADQRYIKKNTTLEKKFMRFLAKNHIWYMTYAA
jgi:hypothetical protein